MQQYCYISLLSHPNNTALSSSLPQLIKSYQAMKNALASYSLSSLLPLVVVLLLIQTPTTTLAQNATIINFLDCPDTSGNFTTGSQYQSNLLNLLFPALVAGASLEGFHNTSSGSDPARVYGLAQCRGDVTMDECKTCLDTATVLISQNCVNKKNATIQLDTCMLRYSSIRFFSKMESSPTERWRWTFNVTDLEAYNKQLVVLMANLIATASTKPSKYDQGWISYTDFNKIYGLVQCTQDLSTSDCSSCLQTMFSFIPSCCNGKSGGHILSPSCQLWYRKDIQFFRLLSSPPPPPSLALPPPSLDSPPPPSLLSLSPPPLPELPTPPPPTTTDLPTGLTTPPSPPSHGSVTISSSKYTTALVFVFFILLMK